MKRLICVSAVAAIVIGVAQVRADNLLVNGSFEVYAVSPYSWWQPRLIDKNIGVNSLSGWTVNQSIDIVSANQWQPHDGDNSLDLCGTPGDGGVSQTFSTLPGVAYNIRFFLSGNPSADFPSEPTNKTLSVMAAGQSANFSFDVATEQNTFANMKWKECDFTFTANSASTTLSINATMGGNFNLGPVIDEVSVAPVPEPSTAGLLSVGAIVIAAHFWRRKQPMA
jgi:choice-of-anchor C domain-containing protein